MWKQSRNVMYTLKHRLLSRATSIVSRMIKPLCAVLASEQSVFHISDPHLGVYAI